MSRDSQRRRLEALEHHIATDPARNQFRATERAQQRDLALWEKVLSAFPEDLHGHIVQQLTPHSHGLQTEHEAIFRLYLLIRRGEWSPTLLPRPLAELYVNDPKATAWNKCLACGLPLPRRSGYWVEEATGNWWQAPMCYFDQCPACGGEIGNWNEQDATRRSARLPAVPNDQYRFLDESPHQMR